MIKDIPADVLQELRFQSETKYRLAFYKTPEFNFLPSLGIGDVFESFNDKEYGYIGTLHLKFSQKKKYWKSFWYDKIDVAINIANEIQSKKIINDDVVINYQMHYIDMIYGRKNSGVVLLS
tara:strand:+ start:152 stop:514 length:363 start_codon:yes stop_codon:yes gene_type:complete